MWGGIVKNTFYFSIICSITVSFCICSFSYIFATASEQVLTESAPVLTPPINVELTKQATTFTQPEQLPISEDLLLRPIFKVFYAAVKNIKDLNYYTAKGIALPLPGTNQEVVFNWGFKGSGNIFTPFTTIKAQIRPALLQVLQQDNPSAFKGVGYVLLQNELFKYTKNTSLIKWLTQASLNPVALFGLKLILLIKTTLEMPQTNNMYAELLRLLFRLNLSENFHMLNKQQSLSSFIPTELKHAAEIQVPGCMEFIDELWEQFTSTTPMQHGTKCYSITCFAFRDKNFAEKIEQRLAKYNSTRFINDTTQLINLNNHQVVNFHDFARFPQSQNLVGFLYTTHLEHKNLPTDIRKTIEATTNFPMIKLVSTETGDLWLCKVSDKLGTIDTIKAIILSLARTLHDYVALKKELLTRQDAEALAYRKHWEVQEHAAEIIQNFLETEDGAISLARLSQEITTIMQPEQAQSTAMQQVITQKDELSSKLQNLEKQRDALTADIDVWEIVKKDKKGKDLTTIQTRIHNLKKQRDEILVSIKQTQNELTKLTVVTTPIAQLEQDQKNLNALMALLAQQQNQGLPVSEQLITTITNLQNKIKLATTNKTQQIDLDQRLEKRTKVAQAFMTEAAILEKQLNEKNTTIQQIDNEEQRIIQELLAGQLQEGYKTYIQRLQQEAQHITDQNEKVNKLKNYKKALLVVGTTLATQEQQQKIQELENQVGYLFTATQEENFIETLKGTHPEFKEFLTDLQSGQEVFKNIRVTLIEMLTNVLNNSEHVQNNIILYQYLIRTFVPELFPLLAPLAYNIVEI